mmetsp:Transcript_5505/g.9357  ORF Transcript_5505/g.9357 Transcript_5505/m.9357 type:complete len:94 (+) Transcript_5505:2503-2784(+)
MRIAITALVMLMHHHIFNLTQFALALWITESCLILSNIIIDPHTAALRLSVPCAIGICTVDIKPCPIALRTSSLNPSPSLPRIIAAPLSKSTS